MAALLGRCVRTFERAKVRFFKAALASVRFRLIEAHAQVDFVFPNAYSVHKQPTRTIVMGSSKSRGGPTIAPSPRRPREVSASAQVVSVPGGELRIHKKLSASARAFIQRSLRVVLDIALADKDEQLVKAAAAPTDAGVIARALSDSSLIAAASTESDPLALLIAKGIGDKEAMIREAGGLLSLDQVAGALGMTAQAVYKRRRAGKLLSVPHGGEEKFPAIQFTTDGQPLPGLTDVLQVLNLSGSWGKLDFLLTPDDEIDGLSPIEVLNQHPEKLEALVRLASTQGEQGAV